MSIQRLLLMFCYGAILLVVVALIHRHRPATVPTRPAPISRVANESPPSFAGTASCAGRSCHGGLEASDRRTSWQKEYTLWVSHDPHERAYRRLLEPAAKEMTQRLGKGNNAHQVDICLACHTNPVAPSLPDGGARVEHSFGVGCESCHGNAANWLDAHLTRSWQTKGAAEKVEHGFTDLGDTTALVKSCVGCHVGAPGDGKRPARDVNHDLIAAGHPRLAFEASSFFANLPRHWKPKPRDEVELWAIGQVVSAEAALELLRHRMSADAPWPEFAEYDCSGCHHGLQASSWRQAPGGRRGRLAWGTWYLTLPQLLGPDAGVGGLWHIGALTRTLEQKMPSKAVAGPQLDASLEELKQLRERLGEWKRPDVAAKKRRWFQWRTQLDYLGSWDEAEQIYLGLYALGQPGLKQLLEERTWPPRSSFVPEQFLKRLRQP